MARLISNFWQTLRQYHASQARRERAAYYESHSPKQEKPATKLTSRELTELARMAGFIG